MSGSLSPIARWTVYQNGRVVPLAKLYTYLSGTSTPHPVYDNADLAVGHAHANPVIANSGGVFPVLYLDAVSYRYLVTDANGATVFAAQDDIYDFGQMLAASGGAASIGFLQEGTGAVARTMQDKLRDGHSITDFADLADGDDATAAITATIAAARALGKTTIDLPGGTFHVSSTISILGQSGQFGVRLRGSGLGTKLLWTGDATGPMFYLGGSFLSQLDNIRMAVFSASFPIASMIVQEQAGAGTSSMNTYRHLLIEGLGVMTQGIYLKGSVTDANNDFTDFEKVFINGYTEAGLLLQGANCFNNRVIDCQIAGGRVGHYGIKSISGAGGEAAHVAVYGGALLGNLISDVYIQTRNSQPFIFDNVYSEGSQAFMTTGTNGNATTIAMRGLKYANDLKTGTDPDIQIGFPGHITLEDSQLGTDYAKAIKITWNYSGGFFAPSFHCRGVRVWGTPTALATIFPGNVPTSMLDTFYQTSDTTYGQLRVGASVSWAAAPVIGGVTSESGQAYGSTFGKYARMGDGYGVQFWATVTLTTKGTITGDVVIKNLPFALQTGTGTVICNVYFANLATNWIMVQGLLDAGTTQLRLVGAQAAGAAPIALTTADIANNTVFIISGTYWTD